MGTLPATEFLLGLVISLGVSLGCAFAVGGRRVDAGVGGAILGAGVGFGLFHWRFPVVDAEQPLAVAERDVGLVNDALGQGVVEFDGAEVGELDAALAVVADVAYASGGSEGVGARESFLVEGGTPALGVGISPVGDGGAEVADGAFRYAVRDFCDEGELFLLTGVEFFVEVLPRWPGQSVGAAEAVGGDAEVVDETSDADGAAAVGLLLDGESQRAACPAGTWPPLGSSKAAETVCVSLSSWFYLTWFVLLPVRAG